MSVTTDLSGISDELRVGAAVLEELRRIRAVCGLARAVSQMLEAQLMESLWKVRREVSERGAFEGLIRSHTELEPGRAWLMAETWEVARRNRELRELAADRPREAMALVSQFVEAGVEERLEDLGKEDREVAEVMAKPPRQRNAAIRELIAAGRAVSEGRHPGDRERIAALEAERDEAVAELGAARKVADMGSHPRAQLRESVAELRGLESSLAELAERLEGLLPGAGESARRQVLAAADMAVGSLERISGAATDGDED